MTDTTELGGLLQDTLRVPEEHADSLPCVRRQDLFTDPLLDVALDNEDFVTLPAAEQHAQVALKQAVERECVIACQSCPILDQCREWSLGGQVHGVAGGLTESQRAAAKGQPTLDQSLLVTDASDVSALRDHQIHAMTVQGFPASVIAESLGVDERTVQRRRKSIRENGLRMGSQSPQHAAAPADNDETGSASGVDYAQIAAQASHSRMSDRSKAKSDTVHTERVSDLTAEIYRFLADGAVARRRDDVIAAVEHLVDPQQAARSPRGARQVILNRLRIAERDGRIESVVHNKVTYVKLHDSVRDQFSHDTQRSPSLPALVS